MTAYAYTVITNKFGGWTPAALAERLGMKLIATGEFAGWLTTEQVEEVRQSGVTFKLVDFKFDK